MKIAIIGYSGSGKSTLAAIIGKAYGLPVLHIDKINFCGYWEERDRAEVLKDMRDFIDKQDWVIDGNYSNLLYEERMSYADRIVFMSFNRFSCLKRATARYRKFKNTTRESAACPEKMDWEFVWWIIAKGRRKPIRKRYASVVGRYRNKTDIIRNQKQLDDYIKTLKKTMP
ncbi:MAG: DNA topology modulation protein FlaR [Clostridia bacterium]|nr:DNA topology modulation protein FlaR [Clostridia bacterium]